MIVESVEQRLERINKICEKIRELQDMITRYDGKYLDSPLANTDLLLNFLWNRSVFERNRLEEEISFSGKHLVKS